MSNAVRQAWAQLDAHTREIAETILAWGAWDDTDPIGSLVFAVVFVGIAAVLDYGAYSRKEANER